MQRKPIYSTREDEPELEQTIGDFVVGLAERVDTLQDLHTGRAFDELAFRCRETAATADELGYPTLAEVASRVALACDERKHESAEAGLVEMAEVTRRMRQAHRGAA